jgi:hypothetical protein
MFWARNFGPMQGRRSKKPGGVFENTLRTFLTENAAAGQKGRPKPNACEISGLGYPTVKIFSPALTRHESSQLYVGGHLFKHWNGRQIRPTYPSLSHFDTFLTFHTLNIPAPQPSISRYPAPHPP